MIQAIIFDCFGVLTADVWQDFLASLPPEQREEASALNRAYDAAHLTRDELLQAMHELTNKHLFHVEDSLDGEFQKNIELLNYIKNLKQTYKIGLLSNIGTNWVRDHFLTTEEQALFDVMIFSFEVGLVKPDEQIYQLTSDRLHLLPENCVMIDDVTRNCEAAQGIGMKAVQYQNFSQMRSELDQLLGANPSQS